MAGDSDQSSLLTVVGLLVAGVAIVGTQVLGWKWGSGQLLPTMIGAVAAGVAVVVAGRRVLE